MQGMTFETAGPSRCGAGGPVFLARPGVVSSSWEDAEFRAYWEGLIFIPGIESGSDSVRAFLDLVRVSGVTGPVRRLRGTFFLAVVEKKTGDLFALVDNSGLYQAFYRGPLLSSSFLELARREGLSAGDLDPDSVAEFLYFGDIFSYRTFFAQIRKIPWNAVYCLRPGDREPRLLRKEIQPIDGTDGSSRGFESIIMEAAQSLRNRLVSIDLTGGVDSRLLAAMFRKSGLPFEVAVSGGEPDYEDVRISHRVAGVIGSPLFATIHSLHRLEEELVETFFAADGLSDVLSYHRLHQLQKARSSRGIDTMVSGAGGELFKDYWWLQDFPLYRRRKARIERLVDMRIMTSEPVHHLLAAGLRECGQSLRGRIVRELSAYAGTDNTSSYDSIFYHWFMSGAAGRILTANTRHVACYAPYLDIEAAKTGFRLPRGARFFNAFHRKMLTDIDPRLAALPTTEGGMSASSSAGRIIADLPKFAGNRLQRLLIKAGIRKRAVGGRNHVDLMTRVRELGMMKDALETLKEIGVIDGSRRLDEIGDGALGPCLSMAMLVNCLDGSRGRCGQHRP